MINQMRYLLFAFLITSFGNCEVATFGGGCFWCIEAVFSRINGVISAVPGYSGGDLEYPTYEQVKTGETGHAEVVQVTFDPLIISFNDLLEIYFNAHDPTQLNRQNDEDVGTQYRSVIFYHSSYQKELSEQYIQYLTQKQKYKNPIVTQLNEISAFYPAEEYHWNYYMGHQKKPYCESIVKPKVDKITNLFKHKLKAEYQNDEL